MLPIKAAQQTFHYRSTLIKYPVFSPKFTFGDDGTTIIAAEGLLVDLLYLIQDQFNFTTSLSVSVDGKFGGKSYIPIADFGWDDLDFDIVSTCLHQ